MGYRMNSVKSCCVVSLLVTVLVSCGVSLPSSSAVSDERNFEHWCKIEDGQFKSREGGCQEIATGVTWGMRLAQPMTVDEAEAACKSYVDGGYDDWTLPTKNDLVRLGESGNAAAYFDFPSSGMFFWATHPNSLTLPQAVDLMTGERLTMELSDKSAVVCVRKRAYQCEFSRLTRRYAIRPGERDHDLSKTVESIVGESSTDKLSAFCVAAKKCGPAFAHEFVFASTWDADPFEVYDDKTCTLRSCDVVGGTARMDATGFNFERDCVN